MEEMTAHYRFWRRLVDWRMLCLLVFMIVGCKEQGGPAAAPASSGFFAQLSQAAIARTTKDVTYDPAYVAIDYPMGDVPDNKGVCADVIVRVYRSMGIDLQQRVHEDMTAAFAAYPTKWGHRRPDPNIDHRRVLNLETFFRRQGAALPISTDARHYRAGDIVTWKVEGRPHIGFVVGLRSRTSGQPLTVHNIGAGPRLYDTLFTFPITGHYRYRPAPEG